MIQALLQALPIRPTDKARFNLISDVKRGVVPNEPQPTASDEQINLEISRAFDAFIVGGDE